MLYHCVAGIQKNGTSLYEIHGQRYSISSTIWYWNSALVAVVAAAQDPQSILDAWIQERQATGIRIT